MASSSSSVQKVLKRANPSKIQDKFLVGYQGWFTCPGDGAPVGPGHHGWLHWFDAPIPTGGRPNIDVWPDVSDYSPSELYHAPGLKTHTGDQVFLFSSRNAKTVQRHFHWMAEHGVDGAFLQRFASQCDLEHGNEGIMRIRDEVGDRVREAAEREGRVFAIMYDVSGVSPDRIRSILERDWLHLVHERDVLDSPNYLKEKGKPVVALWGFGFEDARHTPELVRSVTKFFRDNTPGGVYIMAGTPASWRTAEGDADRNPAFLDVWMNDFDAISPWTVGRYRTEKDADDFFESKMKGDFDLIKKHNEMGVGRRIDYIPVVLPGGSGFNLSQGKWAFNDIRRNGGRFLWKQISNAKRLGVRTIYGAMWDEYDEGTAFMPIVEHKRYLPQSDKYRFMALDEDGYDIPADWYMRICGFAGEGLRSERQIFDTFPIKELQDYWSSRPKYEEVSHKSGEFVSGSSAGGSSSKPEEGGAGQTYDEWLKLQKENKEEAPPPPYSLEAAQETSPASPNPVSVPTVVVAAAAPAAALAVTSTAQNYQIRHEHEESTVNPQSQSTGGNNFGPSTGSTSLAPLHIQNHHNTSSITLGHSQQYHDPVSSLTDDFRRQNLSSSAVETSGNVGGRILNHSPPPLHPQHLTVQSASSGGSPYTSQQQRLNSSQPNLPSRPGVSSGSVQSQWPPPEWKVKPSGTNNPSQPPVSSYGAVTTVVGSSTLCPSSSLQARPPSARPPSAASKPSQPSTGYYTSPISEHYISPVYPPPATAPHTHSGNSPHVYNAAASSYPQSAGSSYSGGVSPPLTHSHSHGHGHEHAHHTHNHDNHEHSHKHSHEHHKHSYEHNHSHSHKHKRHGSHSPPHRPSVPTYAPPSHPPPSTSIYSSHHGSSSSTLSGTPTHSNMPGPGFTSPPWPSGPGYSTSPPHSPPIVGTSSFPMPNQLAYSGPYNAHSYSNIAAPSHATSPQEYSHAQHGVDGGGGYYSMPIANPSSSYSGQGNMSYPQTGGVPIPTAGPWVPPGQGSTSIPPRPYGQSQSSGPGFPQPPNQSGLSGSIGKALNAVEKFEHALNKYLK